MASDRLDCVSVSALCEMANISRNSLYRYHPDVLRALREHQRRINSAPVIRCRVSDDQQAEVITLRRQTAQLAALIDHYYAAYREVQALLNRREQELAQLRRQLDSKPVRLAK